MNILKTNKKIILSIILLLIISVFTFAYLNKENTIEKVTIANPASVFCVENGGTLSNINTDQGTFENCTFPENKTCESWALFRGECLVNGVNNFAIYTNSSSTLEANFRIKSNTVIINSKELDVNFLELNSAVSASGIRYLSSDEKVEFWEHQGEATLSIDGKQVFVGK